MRTVKYAEVKKWWREFNTTIFRGLLSQPKFRLGYYPWSSYHGWIEAFPGYKRVWRITINLCWDKEHFGEDQWISTLAHEMVHQYDWEVLGFTCDMLFDNHSRFPFWQRKFDSCGYNLELI